MVVMAIAWIGELSPLLNVRSLWQLVPGDCLKRKNKAQVHANHSDPQVTVFVRVAASVLTVVRTLN